MTSPACLLGVELNQTTVISHAEWSTAGTKNGPVLVSSLIVQFDKIKDEEQ